MVELINRKYGADLIGSKLYLSALTISGEKKTVDLFLEVNTSEGEKQPFENNSEIYFSADSSEALVKRIKVPPLEGLESEKIALFELQTFLLDESERYYKETYKLDHRPEFLAVAYSREKIDSKMNLLRNFLPNPKGFKQRALALYEGFKHFCRNEGGEMICLADFGREEITLCFVENGQPVATDFLRIQDTREEWDSELPSDILIDLTAILKYQSSLLFQAGFSVPLSTIVISGNKSGEELVLQIQKNTRIKAVLPKMKNELFAPELAGKAHKFLVSIGLTVAN